ncbi:MAG: hypothetical protein WCQ97_00820 [Aminobacterium sp.]|jgi:hypothetical protein|uniref:Uncharacterized protein n=1 Tax=bioreactor metagenome TaxID=1076179 RepID=A0A645AQB8_9ZZZZ|nr:MULTISPECIES: hypothetical protein [unclassified Aminobacterium]MDD2205901.1 hypothetical protein [Aminobacterium sp.]MDD3426557.1 hypothetical protein [Aminobacterium sp.]MDD3706650.1 hypothetical protein [Aminobacterium sp.]MDD4228084.1 hypothetical protein [Aminobacterium sp.]MDD4550829.1 hypothetical protein [Aminobacterium sp.]
MYVCRILDRDKKALTTYWEGVLELPNLIEEVLADRLLKDNNIEEYEASLPDWWGTFIGENYL